MSDPKVRALVTGGSGALGAAILARQDADDVSALLTFLHIQRADIMGFSNGGTTALQIAIRHSGQVNHLVLASARRGSPHPALLAPAWAGVGIGLSSVTASSTRPWRRCRSRFRTPT